MASNEPAESFGEAVAALLKIAFSLTFPLVCTTLCLVSFLLAFGLNAPEFALWAGFSVAAFHYAKTNTWAAIALAIFVLAALPLAWVAFRECQASVSQAILLWVITAMVVGFTIWLRTVWPYRDSGWQIWAYGILLFSEWSGVIEAGLSTLKIIAFYRAKRPRPVQLPRQQPHGSEQRRGSAEEPNTI